MTGCKKTLNRAYSVANFLRSGQELRTNPGKHTTRNNLGWIAVSGEDDAPHRPVNVPSSDFPQYDINVVVNAPLALPPNPPTVIVSTRFVVAQSKPPAAPPPVVTAPWALAPDPQLAIAPGAEVLLFVHGMDSRAEEANDIITALFKRMAGSPRNLVVIAMDLPTSGYATNLDFDKVSPLQAIGIPKLTTTPLPIPIEPTIYGAVIVPLFASLGMPPPPPVIPPGTSFPDFAATGKAPLLDFIENFIAHFVDAVDRQAPFKANVKAVMGGSLGGNLSLRLGRRPDLAWIPAIVAWSPASIWDSLGEGADLLKHLGPRQAWIGANKRTVDAADRHNFFYEGFDKVTVPGLIPAQSETWTSAHYLCKRSAVLSARLDRQETYDAQFLRWHWRLGAEQLLYSHQSADEITHQPRFTLNYTRMLLACGTEDEVPFNNICSATQKTAARMTMTPGKALFLGNTGHSLDNERRDWFAQQVDEFLKLK